MINLVKDDLECHLLLMTSFLSSGYKSSDIGMEEKTEVIFSDQYQYGRTKEKHSSFKHHKNRIQSELNPQSKQCKQWMDVHVIYVLLNNFVNN